MLEGDVNLQGQRADECWIRYFVAEKAFDKITVFEQRSTVGGIWNYTPEDRSDGVFAVPQTDPSGRIEEPIWHEAEESKSKPPVVDGDHAVQSDGVKSGKKVASFVSPMYERLETNIPRSLMRFSDLAFPEDTQLFPKHETVLEYLKSYAGDVKHLIEFETQVVDVRLLAGEERGKGVEDDKWRVRTRKLVSGESKEEIYDAVVVASGHFDVPYLPDIPGIKEWNEKYPGSISHSKYFRKPEEFKGKVSPATPNLSL